MLGTCAADDHKARPKPDGDHQPAIAEQLAVAGVSADDELLFAQRRVDLRACCIKACNKCLFFSNVLFIVDKLGQVAAITAAF